MTIKIAGNDKWDDAYNFGGAEDGVVVSVGSKVELTNGGGSKDMTFTATKDCNLKFTVDLTGSVATLLVEETTDPVTGPAGSSTPSTPSTPSGGVNLDGLNSLALAGTGIPGVPDWDPGAAAGDLTKSSKGVYTKVIAVTAGTAMKFKIAGNDAWDDAYNFGGAEDGVSVTLGKKLDLTNGAGSKDLSLTVNKDCNLKFTVNLKGDVATLLVEETTDAADTNPDNGSSTPAPGGPTVTVYARVPSAWSDVRVWAWDDNQNNATSAGWPGDIVMTKGDDGWYYAEVPQGYPNLLINANGGAAQTEDVAGVLTDKPVYLDCVSDTNAKPTPVIVDGKIEIVEPDPDDVPAATERPNVEPTQPAGTVDNTAKPAGSDNTVLLCIIGSVVIIAVAAVVFIVLKKKKA
jgi:hypothetical protein